jgi:hypothetical protein
MLTHKLQASWHQKKSRNQAVVLCAFSFRYDADLVLDLLENVAPFTDGWLSWDDRDREDVWYHEGEVRNRLIKVALQMGADWLLPVDPDERFEARTRDVLPGLTREKRRTFLKFDYRELYTPDSYRIDGLWGTKWRYSVIPLFPNHTAANFPVHSPWYPHPPPSDYGIYNTNLNLYHLKMIDPANRIARRDLYTSLDPESKIQPIGYDYLTNEDNIELERIPLGREYHPPFRKTYCIRQIG